MQLGFYRDQFSFIHAIMPELAQIPFIRNLQQDLLFNVLLNVNEYDFSSAEAGYEHVCEQIRKLEDKISKNKIKLKQLKGMQKETKSEVEKTKKNILKIKNENKKCEDELLKLKNLYRNQEEIEEE